MYFRAKAISIGIMPITYSWKVKRELPVMSFETIPGIDLSCAPMKIPQEDPMAIQYDQPSPGDKLYAVGYPKREGPEFAPCKYLGHGIVEDDKKPHASRGRFKVVSLMRCPPILGPGASGGMVFSDAGLIGVIAVILKGKKELDAEVVGFESFSLLKAYHDSAAKGEPELFIKDFIYNQERSNSAAELTMDGSGYFKSIKVFGQEGEVFQIDVTSSGRLTSTIVESSGQ